MTKINETPSASNTGATPQIEAPPLAPAGVPLCFVVDEEASIRHFLSLVLHGVGIDTLEFPDGKALREAIGQRAPNLIFHNISLDAADALETMIALGQSGFRGSVQLMSSRGAAVLEHVKEVGTQHKLTMLPILKKPFETEVIVKIVRDLNLGEPPAIATQIGLQEALANNWIEFWYQPKIDIRRKKLAGAEGYARARHPKHGIVLPNAFMPNASKASLLRSRNGRSRARSGRDRTSASSASTCASPSTSISNRFLNCRSRTSSSRLTPTRRNGPD